MMASIGTRVPDNLGGERESEREREREIEGEFYLTPAAARMLN